MEKNTKSFLFQVKSSISSSPYKLQIVFLFLGVILVIAGLIFKNQQNTSGQNSQLPDNNVEAVTSDEKSSPDLIIDVSGAVVNEGVYHMKVGDRIEDALIKAGGLSSDADRNWVNKNLDRAAKLSDGQKIFIPSLQQSNVLGANNLANNTNVAQSENTSDSTLININTASLTEIETLPGIGQTYGQKIIDHRPYSDIKELLSNQVLKQSLYDKIKDKITIY